MNIIRPARYWWAEKTVGDIPVRYGVKMGQQRLIERLHRQRIGKVYALLPGGCKREELPEFRIDLTKRGEIVAAVMTVARMQPRFLGGQSILL